MPVPALKQTSTEGAWAKRGANVSGQALIRKSVLVPSVTSWMQHCNLWLPIASTQRSIGTIIRSKVDGHANTQAAIAPSAGLVSPATVDGWVTSEHFC